MNTSYNILISLGVLGLLALGVTAVTSCGEDAAATRTSDVPQSTGDKDGSATADPDASSGDTISATPDAAGPGQQDITSGTGSDPDASERTGGGRTGELTQEAGPCVTYCDAVMGASCVKGPPSHEACLAGCKEAEKQCKNDFSALETCASDDPAVECVHGQAVVVGCAVEETALLLCLDPCGSYCQGTTEAACDETPYSACVAACNQSRSYCQPEFKAAVECIGLELSVSCQDGRPIAVGCETEQAALLSCGAKGNPTELCGGFCEAVVAAGCAQGPPSTEQCLEGCQNLSFGPCAEINKTVLTCAGETPTFTCLEGSEFPVPVGCEAKGQALLACLQSE